MTEVMTTTRTLRTMTTTTATTTMTATTTTTTKEMGKVRRMWASDDTDG